MPRIASGIFSAQMLRNAYEEWPGFRAAVDRKDWSEVERLGTHMVLGATMAAFGIKHAATGEPAFSSAETTEAPTRTSVFESYRQAGQSFSSLKNRVASADTITESATGLYNKIQNTVLTLQGALQADGARTIQDAIAADKAALMNTNRGSISTAGAVADVSKALEETGYNRDMTAADRAQIGKVLNQSDLTLEEAKNLRSTVGRAMTRAKDPRWKAVLTSAYDQLGEGMKGRIVELQGTSRPYEHYNNQFKASFELEDGIAGKMLENLRCQDRNAAIPKIADFAKANLSEIQEQMRKMGLNNQSKVLDSAKTDAKALSNAHEVVNGKYIAGVWRLFMQNPKAAWPGLVTMLAAHGVGIPFPIPQMLGTMTAAGSIGLGSRMEAGRVYQRLTGELPPAYFRTRTQAEVPEKFDYKNPDEGWGAFWAIFTAGHSASDKDSSYWRDQATKRHVVRRRARH